MYDFHYNYIKEKYDNNARLLFTDKDSLTYNIRTEDIYCIKAFGLIKTNSISAIIIKIQVFYDPTNEKVIGKMKGETKSVPIVEFVGLRS